MNPRVLFDAVLFDLDGTLVATDRFWVSTARAGAQRAFAELGIEREVPSGAAWMSLVGYPLRQGIARLMPELDARQVAHVLACCVAEEEAQVRSGNAAFLPGAVETLDELARQGVPMGIASNCSNGYLGRMLSGLGLARWIREARCLDSAGVASKADMIRDLLRAFGTRSAVFVGDRRGDGEAAWENGIPHVHYAGAFAEEVDRAPADAEIRDLRDLVPLLEQRALVLEGVVEALGLGGGRVRSVAVTGPSGVGKGIWARDLARVLAGCGRRAVVVELEWFARSPLMARTHLADPVGMAYELELLLEQVLRPHARGERVVCEREGRRVVVEPGEVLLLEGVYLVDGRLAGGVDAVVYLQASDEVCLRRIAGRDAGEVGPETLIRARRLLLPSQRELERRVGLGGGGGGGKVRVVDLERLVG